MGFCNKFTLYIFLPFAVQVIDLAVHIAVASLDFYHYFANIVMAAGCIVAYFTYNKKESAFLTYVSLFGGYALYVVFLLGLFLIKSSRWAPFPIIMLVLTTLTTGFTLVYVNRNKPGSASGE